MVLRVIEEKAASAWLADCTDTTLQLDLCAYGVYRLIRFLLLLLFYELITL
jgi:hypothetical protein